MVDGWEKLFIRIADKRTTRRCVGTKLGLFPPKVRGQTLPPSPTNAFQTLHYKVNPKLATPVESAQPTASRADAVFIFTFNSSEISQRLSIAFVKTARRK